MIGTVEGLCKSHFRKFGEEQQMSRHRNLKQFIDEEDWNDDDYYDDEDEEGEVYVAPKKTTTNSTKKQQTKPPQSIALPATNITPEIKLSKRKKKGTKFWLKKLLKPSQVTGSSINEVAKEKSLSSLKSLLGPSRQSTLNDLELRSILEKHSWNEKFAQEEVISLLISRLKISPTTPQSELTRVLQERPPKQQPKSVQVSGELKQQQATTFAFDIPSPDDIILNARKNQERTQPAAVISGPKPTQQQQQQQQSDEKLPSKQQIIGSTDNKVKTKAEEKRDEEDDAIEAAKKPLLSLVVIGHVDAGKSTLMGHFLYDLGLVSQKEMHKFEKESKDLGKASFKYAWVMDEHQEERERGVTIDVGMKRFETNKRRIVLLDAPGHKDYIPNMITGATQADAALLVVPAVAGEFESTFAPGGQTREHALLVHSLGVHQLIIAINKMDSCNWDPSRFEFIKTSVEDFLINQVKFQPNEISFIPCSGLTGENLVKRGENLPDWVPKNQTLQDLFDALPAAKRPILKPLRIVIADSYKSMQLGNNAVGGKIEAGIVRVNDIVLVSPFSDVTATVSKILVHGDLVRRAKAGDNVEIGLASKDNTLSERLGKTGIILCDPKFPIPIQDKLRAQIQTLPNMKYVLHKGSTLIFHAHTVEVPCTIVELHESVGPNNEKIKPRHLKSNQLADITIKLNSPICIEKHSDFKPLSRFLLRFSDQTMAAGIVTEFEK